MGQNETKRHFETRDLEGAAKRVQQQAYAVKSKEEVSRQARQRLLLGVTLVLVLLLLAWLLGAFHPNFGLTA